MIYLLSGAYKAPEFVISGSLDGAKRKVMHRYHLKTWLHFWEVERFEFPENGCFVLRKEGDSFRAMRRLGAVYLSGSFSASLVPLDVERFDDLDSAAAFCSDTPNFPFTGF